jgi:CubicO group peptidase (beta-lactamase class C family)
LGSIIDGVEQVPGGTMPSVRFPRLICVIAAAALLTAVPVARFGQSATGSEAKVDTIFERWTNSSGPGCAVAVGVDGKPILAKAYGMADLEHDIKNRPDTIFEAGSVSKQFTAAAVLLLARDGKLSLDDPVRKYIPELPDYGTALTIRHMLNHTSGLRDWGNVAAIAGWPRTSRVYTHAHVLEIVSRQHSLNFPPGSHWSYSNTGYNLAAILVSRVSGTSFSDFTKRRIFEPLGMTHTSWRDDHTRVVKGRAIAYSEQPDGFHTLMPFENVHGNGGLLTTVGDLLKWNENFADPKVGDASFAAQQQQPGKFNDGRSLDYAFGLFVGSYKGLREIYHSGSTAGYNAFLTRYPDQRVSVAILCNATTGAATQYAHAVADIYLANHIRTEPAPAAKYTLTEKDTNSVIGLYRDTQTGNPLTISAASGTLRSGNVPLIAVSASRFVTPLGNTYEIDAKGARVTDALGTVVRYERVEPVQPNSEQLQEYVGTYASDEAETSITVAVEKGALILKRRPDITTILRPVYADAFSTQGITVIFRRDGGRVSQFSVSQDRVWDLRFTKK